MNNEELEARVGELAGYVDQALSENEKLKEEVQILREELGGLSYELDKLKERIEL